jgi:hypothetical protein
MYCSHLYACQLPRANLLSRQNVLNWLFSHGAAAAAFFSSHLKED